jgi:hypothetical protein
MAMMTVNQFIPLLPQRAAEAMEIAGKQASRQAGTWKGR